MWRLQITKSAVGSTSLNPLAATGVQCFEDRAALDGLLSQAGHDAGVIGPLGCLGEFLQREYAQRHSFALSQFSQSLGFPSHAFY